MSRVSHCNFEKSPWIACLDENIAWEKAEPLVLGIFE